MKVLMLNPSSSSPQNRREYILGLSYLASTLRINGYSDLQYLNFFNMPWSETESMTVKALEDFKPNVILISFFTINRIAGCKTAKIAKELDPSVKVVVGGIHPSFMYHQILLNYPVDAVCIGEGEDTVLELLNSFKDNRAIDGVKGIAYKKGGIVLETTRRPFIKDLDTIPFPAHDFHKDYLNRTQRGYLISSRGCPYGCQFCSTTQFWGKSWRARTSKNTVDEIEMLIRYYGINHINFMDDEFTLNRKRTIEICKEIIDRGFRITWNCATRVDTIDEEQLEWMMKSGCNDISLGIESGSPKILKSIGKKIKVEEIIKAFELLDKYGLSRGAYMMVGNPGEDKNSINETIQLVKKLKLDVPSVAVAELYPGTPLYDIAKGKGFISDDYWLKESPPPFYTVEHSAEKLQWWAFLIVLNGKKAQGYLKLFSFLASWTMAKRKKIIKRIVKLAFGANKEPYTYK